MAIMKKEQLEFLNWEFGVFLHFGIRTFNEGHEDWDMKPMEPQLVNHVVLNEVIDSYCEIESFEIKAYPYCYGVPITVFRGTTIGHKAICPFPTIYTNHIEITFDKEKTVTAQLKYAPMFE